MAVVNSKSTAITAFDARPRTRVGSHLHSGSLMVSRGTVEVAAGDDDGSVYRMLRLPSNAIIDGLFPLNDSITGGSDYDLGVYDTIDNNLAAVVDVNRFADAISMVGGRAVYLNAAYEDSPTGIINMEKRLWERLGLSSDPNKDYDICYTGVTVGSASGTLGLVCHWSQ